MITITSFFLILAVLVFLLTYRLKLKTRFIIAAAIWLVPSIAILSLLIFIRDKPSPYSYGWYSGFPHIDSTAPGEQNYQKLVAAAKELEQKGNLDEAIDKYYKAMKVPRIVVPSYYVLFDIARCQFDLKRYELAHTTLRSFLSNVDMELTYKEGKGVKEPPPGGFMIADQTKEHLDALLADKAKAEELIKKIAEVSKDRRDNRPR